MRVRATHVFRIATDTLPDLSSWPTVPHFFDSLHAGYIQHASAPLYWYGWGLIQASWTLSFVVIMIKSPSLQLQRFPIFFTYMGRIVLRTIPELFWHNHVWETMKRLNWSHDFGARKTVAVPSLYETLKRYPSLLWGPRRAIVLALVAIIFTTFGFIPMDAHWARWTGTMTLIELMLRTTARTFFGHKHAQKHIWEINYGI